MKNFSLIYKWLLLITILLSNSFLSTAETPPPRLSNSDIQKGWCILNNDTVNKLYPGAIYIVHSRYGEYLLPKSELKFAEDNTLQLPNMLQLDKYTVSVKLLSVPDTSKWHPEAIYFILPDRKLTFKLPKEKNQDPSGVANLLFQSKKTGIIHLRNTKGGRNPAFNVDLLSGEYDAILLYNNGKYLKYNNVAFEQNSDKEVDMENLNIYSSDSESCHWLTLRAFNTPIKERIYLKNYSTVSEKKIRGYVYNNSGYFFAVSPFVTITNKDGKKWVKACYDGYFEIDADVGEVFEIDQIGFITKRIKVTENCGVIILMGKVPTDRKVLDGRIGATNLYSERF